MKKLSLLPFGVLLVAATAFITPVMGQDWIPGNGYWEVITTVKKPKSSIVQFYDLQGHMIYEEQVTGRVVNVRKRKTCVWLNKQLQSALAAWAARK